MEEESEEWERERDTHTHTHTHTPILRDDRRGGTRNVAGLATCEEGGSEGSRNVTFSALGIRSAVQRPAGAVGV